MLQTKNNGTTAQQIFFTYLHITISHQQPTAIRRLASGHVMVGKTKGFIIILQPMNVPLSYWLQKCKCICILQFRKKSSITKMLNKTDLKHMHQTNTTRY